MDCAGWRQEAFSGSDRRLQRGEPAWDRRCPKLERSGGAAGEPRLKSADRLRIRSHLHADQDIYWSLLGPNAGTGKSSAEEFAAGMQRVKSIENRVVVDTPDAWLNAGVGASSIVVDACYRDGVYSHSGMRWSTALLGWRTVFGGTVFGWHDLVKDDARLFISHQITEDDPKRAGPVADPKTRLSSQAPNSRMFGKGRIDLHDPHHYDMQSQFFDQVVHAWRWTGDAELEKLLRPSLDLDCQWIKDCFDPSRARHLRKLCQYLAD